ncbi:hypothetical protein M4R22_12390 [Acidovorax sp. GBBC 3334]|uniref:hypothetical protein n=1 Tax=unclassified Acidovorax TaxID=2684926 RepID=UPI00230359B7|nr:MULTISPECIES: hypothetical protein [unclassified Acidovorax]MDA8455563.1 hypothetical protein [Acidovorax sp. GBBC 3334]MDA8522685.1 hypothetical protein [Acidovorax sp. NCPPB 4044]
MTIPHQANEPASADRLVPASDNADFKGAQSAIRRAAQRARQLAQQTGTDLIVVRAGKVVRVRPESGRPE